MAVLRQRGGKLIQKGGKLVRECAAGDCDNCDPAFSGDLSVDVGNTWIHNGGCSGASNCGTKLSGVFVCTYTGPCTWTYTASYPGECVESVTVTVEITFNTVNYFLNVTLSYAGSGGCITVYSYQSNLGSTKPDCGSFSAESVGISSLINGCSLFCVNGPASVDVSA